MRAVEVPARPWIHARVGELGVPRNRPRDWILAADRDGTAPPPPGPPYDELAWRLWADTHGKGHLLAGATVPDLVAELQRAGVRGYRSAVVPAALQLPTEPVRPPGVAVDGTVEPAATLEQAAAQNKALGEYLKVQALHREHLEESRQLIRQDDVGRLLDALADVAIAVLNRIPSVADEASALPEERDRLRRLLLARVDTARSKLREEARVLLRGLLDAPAEA